MSASSEARLQRQHRLKVVYRMLAEAANDGSPAPTNAILREQVGLRSVSTVSDLVAALEDRGMIRVDRSADARVIHIIATGKATASPAVWKEPVRRVRGVAQQALADQFDDALAETGSVADSAAMCGLTLPAAERRFTRIRQELGWQAQ